MPHFLIKKEEIFDDFIVLKNEDNFFHIVKVLRTKIGEKIKFIDESQNIYFTQICEINKNSLKALILEKDKSNRILRYKLNLVQSILLGDSQSLLIGNAVQTGVKKIYPVVSDNIAMNKNALKDKVSKWQKIAYENFKQCERGDLPVVCEIFGLREILENFKKENILIFAEKHAKFTLNDCLSDVDKNDEIAIVVGPEGGFSDDEFNYFIQNNYKLITLGDMIYKAPSAAVVAISNIVSRL